MKFLKVATAVSLCAGISAAHAQFAVIDVASIVQLVQQVQQLAQAVQLAQSQYQSITGLRGMQTLVGGINRNYLPSTYPQLATSLATPIQSTVDANAVLTPSQMALLSPAEQQQVSAARNNVALLQVSTQEAYATTSSRFALVQQLIDAIGMTTDEKGILELQGRIQGELAMLHNESTKLELLVRATQAQEGIRQQVAREQVVAGVGNLRSLPALQLP